MASNPSVRSAYLVNYEYPGVTANCGGGGRVTQLLHRHLKKFGVDSTVATDDADGHYATFPVRSYPRLRREVRTDDPDVINGHFSLPSSLTLPSVAPDDTPLVISVMGADVYDPTRFDGIRTAADRANAWLFDQSDAVVAPSRDMQARVRREFGVDCKLIPYGINPVNWEWRQREIAGQPHILTVCRLVDRKNVETAINATRALRASGIGATHEVVGTGPLENRLKEEHQYDWLTFSGYVDDLQDAYDRADIFVLPSEHEAFGIVFLEALACGLPVVCSDQGGQTDIVDDSVGRCVTPGVKSVRDAIEDVIDNYRELQDATEEYVYHNFHAAEMARQYHDLYNEVGE